MVEDGEREEECEDFKEMSCLGPTALGKEVAIRTQILHLFTALALSSTTLESTNG